MNLSLEKEATRWKPNKEARKMDSKTCIEIVVYKRACSVEEFNLVALPEVVKSSYPFFFGNILFIILLQQMEFLRSAFTLFFLRFLVIIFIQACETLRRKWVKQIYCTF